jgi:thioredoxin-related protein
MLFSLPAFAQSDIKIHFEDGLSWAQIKNKAKKEGKYLFVDCVASWCVPCKKMDKEIYYLTTVGELMNSRFISVKVQMDTSKNDTKETINWYGDAKLISDQYKINAFPSYLFFSPEGKLVHREVGYKREKDFLLLAANAIDPAHQYYTLLDNYENGKKDYPKMPSLVKMARSFNEIKLSKTIARDYINNYLMKLSSDKLLTKDNIIFISNYFTSDDKVAFDLFYRQGAMINSIINDETNKNFARNILDNVIIKEEIYPFLWKNNILDSPLTTKPAWRELEKKIAKKYDKLYAERTIAKAKPSWYGTQKDWPNLAKSQIALINKYGFDTAGLSAKFRINNIAWYDIFLHSNKEKELLTAAGWMEIIVKSPGAEADELFPTWADTYANLLYKAGRVKEALIWEEKAAGKTEDEGIKETYEKMKQGKPTWENETDNAKN